MCKRTCTYTHRIVHVYIDSAHTHGTHTHTHTHIHNCKHKYKRMRMHRHSMTRPFLYPASMEQA